MKLLAKVKARNVRVEKRSTAKPKKAAHCGHLRHCGQLLHCGQLRHCGQAG